MEDYRPDPMELLGEMEAMSHEMHCNLNYSNTRNLGCSCWRSKLPALRAAVEAMKAELAIHRAGEDARAHWEQFFDAKENPYQRIPCLGCGAQVIRHVIKEGARYHVLNYSMAGAKCSEKDCEQNHVCTPTSKGGLT